MTTLIVAALADIAKEPVNVVELATYNCPPTAFTVSFSNTVVFKVPRIEIFSNSAWPLFVESNLKPFTPLAKSFVSIKPLELSVRLAPTIVLEPKVHPPTVPDVAFRTPALVTLNGALLNEACPNWIPSSASAIKIVLPVPSDIDLPLASNVKFVAVNVLPLTVNPAICPLLAVILPAIWADDAVICPVLPFNFNVEPPLFDKSSPIVNPPISPVVAVILPLTFALEAVILFMTTLPSAWTWNLLELISMFPLLPLMNCESPPIKNFGVSIVTWLPLNVVVPELNIEILPLEPLIKFESYPR